MNLQQTTKVVKCCKFFFLCLFCNLIYYCRFFLAQIENDTSRDCPIKLHTSHPRVSLDCCCDRSLKKDHVPIMLRTSNINSWLQLKNYSNWVCFPHHVYYDNWQYQNKQNELSQCDCPVVSGGYKSTYTIYIHMTL